MTALLTDAIADRASRENADQRSQPPQRQQIAGEQRIDAMILGEGDDEGRDKEVVKTANRIDGQ